MMLMRQLSDVWLWNSLVISATSECARSSRRPIRPMGSRLVTMERKHIKDCRPQWTKWTDPQQRGKREMEFVNLGKQCAFKECKQLDFLPFKCKHCDESYCLEHRTCASHKCEKEPKQDAKTIEVECPLCLKHLVFQRDSSIDEKVDEHIRRGCNVNAAKLSRRCCLATCKRVELMPLDCRQCKMHFCIKHRMPEDHRCPILAT